MKKNLAVVFLAVGLGGLSLLVGQGIHEQEANAAQVPVDVQSTSPLTNTAEPKPTEAAPAPNPASPAPAAPAPPASPAEKAGTNALAKPSTNLLEAAVIPEDLRVSPALAELVRLLQGGVGEEVLLAYITNSATPFYIGADEILFLHDLGAPAQIITTLIQRDAAPDMAARKQSATAVRPLPPGVALTSPATNLYATAPSQPPPATNPPEPTPVNPPAAAPDAETVAYPVPVEQPTSVSYFYNELAPYGAWVDVAGYGRCWRPTVAVWNSAWRPYADCGRWLWTDAGWYWYSDYSWGWAPFHYGRWTCPGGVGWVWVPDTCWGPSWVSWRYSSSYCGWAPLPPSARFVYGHGFYHHNVAVGFGFEFGLHSSDYVFVSTGGLCNRRPTYLSATHANTVFKDTTVVNNYVTANNASIVNKGVGFDRVSQATRGNIRQVALKGTTDVRPTNPRREVLDNEGKTLTVVRPPIEPPGEDPSAKPGSGQALRPRMDRNTANVAGPRTSSATTDSRQSAKGLESPNSAPQSTLVSPRTGSSSLARPSTAKTSPDVKTIAPAAPPKVDREISRTPSLPIRGTYARPGRTEAPAVGGAVPAPPPSRPASPVTSPSVSRPAMGRPDPTRNPSQYQPQPLPSRGTRAPNPVQGRPNVSAPAPSSSAPRAIQPSPRPAIPSSPRVESYRAPAASPPPVYSAPAPQIRSAPSPSAPPSARPGPGRSGENISRGNR